MEARHKRHEQNDLRRGIDEIKALTLQRFWELPEREINQRLHAILSPYKIVVFNGQVVKLAEHHGRRSRALFRD